MLKRAFITRNSCYNVNQDYLFSRVMNLNYEGISDILIKSGIFSIDEEDEKSEDSSHEENNDSFSVGRQVQAELRIRREIGNSLKNEIEDDQESEDDESVSINARESYEIVKKNNLAYIIDVRPQAESIYGGGPDLSDMKKEAINIPFKLYPSMKQNPKFIDTFKGYIFNKEATTFLLCNDGTTSKSIINDIREFHENCYVIEDGFNGPKDLDLKRRGMISGWKAEGLPWQDR